MNCSEKEEFMLCKYAGGNRRSLSEAKETEILSQFEKMAEKGHVVTTLCLWPVDSLDEGSSFFVMPYCNAECMQVFLNQLRSMFYDDIIVLICDGASWHKSGTPEVPEGISILHILQK